MNQFDETDGKAAGAEASRANNVGKETVADLPRRSTKGLILSGVALAVLGLAGVSIYALYSSRTGDDIGVAGNAQLSDVPTVQVNDFKPVGKTEADRRATVNQEFATAAQEQGASHVSRTVISEEMQAGSPDDPYAAELKALEAQQQAQPTPAPEPQIQERIVYRDQPAGPPVMNPEMVALLNSQIQFAQTPAKTKFVSMAFAKPPPKPAPEPAPKAEQYSPQSNQFGDMQGGAQNVAKPGDIFYGQLWLGFNSDDPQGAPVYATIYDNRADGTRGPLHGARLEGQVAYSDRNAALIFNRVITQDGRIVNAQAMAVDERTARTGIAQKVDFHTFERYSNLLLGSLIQGVGQAANTMLTQNRTTTYIPDLGAIVQSNNNSNTKGEWTRAGLAALQPLGSNLSNVAQQKFQRPPTISANRGHRVGIVFMTEVAL